MSISRNMYPWRGAWGVLVTFFLFISLAGCRTTAPEQNAADDQKEAEEALSAVAGALSGKKLSKEELRGLGKQIRNDEEAQSAIKAITGSVAEKVPAVKYCPITGERYAPHFEVCPVHHVPLEVVGQ